MTDDYDQPEAKASGWTDTLWPNMRRPYRMGCCDCGLVHDIGFGALRLAVPRDLGGYRPTRVRGGIAGTPIYAARDRANVSSSTQVVMRVRRNEAETVRLRASQEGE